MKAIKIDVKSKSVTLIDMENSLDAIYKEVECETITVPCQLLGGDALYVDDEGLLKDFEEVTGGFVFDAYSSDYVLMGNGLVMGHTDEGESQDVRTKLDTITRLVRFVEGEELKQAFDRQSNIGLTFYSF